MFPLFALLGACDMVPKPIDTGIPPECEAVTAACPADGGRAYWSTSEGGGWEWVDECFGVACRGAEHGETRMEGGGDVWIDVWATCSEGFGHLEGVICCYQ